MAHDSSLFAKDIVMLLWSHLHHVCVSLVHSWSRVVRLHPDCIHFSCCSPTAPASAAVPQLHLLQLLLPNCVRFSCCSSIVFASACCSLIVSASTAAPRLHPLQLKLTGCSPLPIAFFLQHERREGAALDYNSGLS